MGPVSYLIIALVVGVVGVLVLMSMNRSPRRPDFAMEEFRREMQALAPKPPVDEVNGGDPAAENGRRIAPPVEPGTPQIKRIGPTAGRDED